MRAEPERDRAAQVIRRVHVPAQPRDAVQDEFGGAGSGVPGLRRDVDTPEDLRAAVALGAGFRTAAVAGQLLAGT